VASVPAVQCGREEVLAESAEDHVQRLDAASAVGLGFPHEFRASAAVTLSGYGSTLAHFRTTAATSPALRAATRTARTYG